jgi:hypothetical protein
MSLWLRQANTSDHTGFFMCKNVKDIKEALDTLQNLSDACREDLYNKISLYLENLNGQADSVILDYTKEPHSNNYILDVNNLPKMTNLARYYIDGQTGNLKN